MNANINKAPFRLLISPFTEGADGDFISPNGDYEFSPLSTRECLDIAIRGDTLLEGLEDLTAELIGIRALDGSILTSVQGLNIDPEETTIQIIDNDGKLS